MGRKGRRASSKHIIGTNEHAHSNGFMAPEQTTASSVHADSEKTAVTITSITPERDANGEIRYFRYGTIVTHWEIKHELPGRLRLKNPIIHRKAELCQVLERELTSVLGIDYFKTNSLTSTVLIQYDRKAVEPRADRRNT